MGKAVPKHSTPVGRTHFQIVGAGLWNSQYISQNFSVGTKKHHRDLNRDRRCSGFNLYQVLCILTEIASRVLVTALQYRPHCLHKIKYELCGCGASVFFHIGQNRSCPRKRYNNQNEAG